MVEADAAEARGDAAAALGLMSNKPLGPDGKPFWRPWRMRALSQLVTLEPALPRWAYSRWILAQALQDLSESGRWRNAKAFQAADRVRGIRDKPTGVDETDAKCKVMDGDWVYRQAFLYEQAGLEDFLKGASEALVGRADRIGDWADAEMGGYQLLGRNSFAVIWRDLATDERFGVANIGCGVMVVPGECAIGRRVPIDGGSMFETAPLLVPRGVAEQVAHVPASWIDVLAERRDDEEPIRTGGHTFDLLSDVPPVAWMYAMLGENALETPSAVTPHVVARAVLTCARDVLVVQAMELDVLDPEAVDPWACLGAALIEPDVAAALPEVMTRSDADTLRRLSEELPGPVSAACRAIADSPRDAA